MADTLRHRATRLEAFEHGLAFPAQDMPSLAISLSHWVLKQWGYDHDNQDKNFVSGILGDLNSIGDPVNSSGVPVDWQFGVDDETWIDLMLIVGQNQSEPLQATFDEWSSWLEQGCSLLHADQGRHRQGDKEFFGFKDGISQPAIRGTDMEGNPIARRSIDPSDRRSMIFAKPGQRLLWPGNFILGYQREVGGAYRWSLFVFTKYKCASTFMLLIISIQKLHH